MEEISCFSVFSPEKKRSHILVLASTKRLVGIHCCGVGENHTVLK